MSTPRTNSAAPLPRWVVLVGSNLISLHFAAVVIFVLAAQSGPWVTPLGPSEAGPPFFLAHINNATSRYLDAIHMAHNYHFQSNYTDQSAVYFEARLKDKAGHEIGTLKFPQDKVNFWVRHRQGLLAMGLANDRPVEGSRGGNPIAAPGKELTVNAWERPKGEKGDNFKLVKKPKQTITLEMEVRGPSSRSYLLAKSYMRYLGRKHDAATVELIRHSRDQILPEVVLFRMPPNLNDMVADFGVEEIRDEK